MPRPVKPIRYSPLEREAIQNWLRASGASGVVFLDCGTQNAAISYHLALHRARKKVLAEADQEILSGVANGPCNSFYLQMKNLRARRKGQTIEIEPFTGTGIIATDLEGNQLPVPDLQLPLPLPPSPQPMDLEELFPSSKPIFGDQ